MKYIVAFAIALITALVDIWAYSWLRHRNTKEIDDSSLLSDEDVVKHNLKNRTMPAAMYFSTVKSLLPRQRVLVICCLLLNALAAVRLFSPTADYFVFARLLITAILLTSVLIIDWNTSTIPNCIILVFLGIGLIAYGLQIIIQPESFKTAIIGAVVGLLGNLILFYFMSRITKEGIGMGDVKLLASVGWMTGVQITLASVLISLLLCCFTAICLIFTKRKQASDSVPFGPYVYFGFIISLLICNF